MALAAPATYVTVACVCAPPPLFTAELFSVAMNTPLPVEVGEVTGSPVYHVEVPPAKSRGPHERSDYPQGFQIIGH